MLLRTLRVGRRFTASSGRSEVSDHAREAENDRRHEREKAVQLRAWAHVSSFVIGESIQKDGGEGSSDRPKAGIDHGHHTYGLSKPSTSLGLVISI